jgi:hypothetical protein
MKVVSEKIVDDCIESSNVVDLLLDNEISKEFIFYLSEFGRLIYQYQIEKPFFKIIVKGRFTLKGSQFNKSIRVLFPDKDYSIELDEIKERIENYII